MPGVSKSLREIHRQRRFIRDLQAEIERGPIQLKARRNVLQKAEDGLKDAQDTLKKLKIRTHENEVTLKTTTQQIHKYERQKEDALDPKQIAAFESQIATARAKADALENETLETYSDIERRTAELPEVEKSTIQARADFAAFEKEHSERLANLNYQLQKAMADLKQVESELPADAVAQYQRIIKSYGADALAMVDGQSCEHCHTQITSQQRFDVEGGHFVCCLRCGRGLYLSE